VAKKKESKVTLKICDRCGQENEPNAEECRDCKNKRFAPEWILAKRPITSRTSVEVTLSNPDLGDVTKRITRSKWWPASQGRPGGSSSFHITKPEHWIAIIGLINDLYPIVGWKGEDEQLAVIKQNIVEKGDVDESILELSKQHPDLLRKIIKALSSDQLAKQDIENIVITLGESAEAITEGSASFREAFLSVLKKLPKEGKKALEELESLLHSWSLQQITTVAQAIRSRLVTIDLFKNQIQNEQTFEITGNDSIHRILERAMWMIDERYWLLQSNASLREFIGKEMSKKDKKKYGKKRPDFVCGSVDNSLIIVELKRPSKTLKVDDLNQLEDYLAIIDTYATKYSDIRAYLVGTKLNDELRRHLRFRRNMRVMTYTDLIDDTEKRYQEYLKSVNT